MEGITKWFGIADGKMYIVTYNGKKYTYRTSEDGEEWKSFVVTKEEMEEIIG